MILSLNFDSDLKNVWDISNLKCTPAIKSVIARLNQQKDLCPQRKLRSAWAEDSDQPGHLLSAQWVAKDPNFLQVDSKDWSDWVDAQADLSLRCVHRSFCWFCCAVAQTLWSFYNNTVEQVEEVLQSFHVCWWSVCHNYWGFYWLYMARFLNQVHF